MTEFDPEGTERKSFPCPSLVNRDSATRWAELLGVESELGELYSDSRSVRSREARSPALIFGGIDAAMVGLCSSLMSTGKPIEAMREYCTRRTGVITWRFVSAEVRPRPRRLPGSAGKPCLGLYLRGFLEFHSAGVQSRTILLLGAIRNVYVFPIRAKRGKKVAPYSCPERSPSLMTRRF